MPLDSAWNMYIFRDGKKKLRGADLLDSVVTGLRCCPERWQDDRTKLIDLLLRAGELECALRDAGSESAPRAESVTRALARSLVSGANLEAASLAYRLEAIQIPAEVQVSAPEGFAYYSLHPLDFADLVFSQIQPCKLAAIIGIRSIGTVLSAVVEASFRKRGVESERITVRPVGHPYDRTTQFSPSDRKWVADMKARGAEFFVVDEGPGMSGSSFLSVGEALVTEEVSKASIAFLCSRMPDVSALTAKNAAQRWPSFRTYYTQCTRHLPDDAVSYIAGGIWRAYEYTDEQTWPASWTQMERLKFLSGDRKRLYKFEGFGRFGSEVHDRALRVGAAGFGPMPLGRDEGFGIYPFLSGRRLQAKDISEETLNRIAEYCAFRAREIPADIAETPELESMLRFNVREEFGVELPSEVAKLPLESPVVADARMLPHKWIESEDGLLKIDNASHGDDHFFPGPTDIAWDVAGVIVEWGLAGASASYLQERYTRESGDNIASRLRNYVLAYSIFRMAYCKMGAAAMAGSMEQQRLTRDYLTYRSAAQNYLLALKPQRVRMGETASAQSKIQIAS